MERLTQKTKNGSYVENLYALHESADNCVTKLGKYEDLEEEIGCSYDDIRNVLKVFRKFLSAEKEPNDKRKGVERIKFNGDDICVNWDEEYQMLIRFINGGK